MKFATEFLCLSNLTLNNLKILPFISEIIKPSPLPVFDRSKFDQIVGKYEQLYDLNSDQVNVNKLPVKSVSTFVCINIGKNRAFYLFREYLDVEKHFSYQFCCYVYWNFKMITKK